LRWRESSMDHVACLRTNFLGIILCLAMTWSLLKEAWAYQWWCCSSSASSHIAFFSSSSSMTTGRCLSLGSRRSLLMH
jgi:hypothetical protein